MATTLPVPIDLRLPGPEWRPVDPASVGVQNAAFFAVRQSERDYTPTISVSGDWRTDTATLEEIGEESARNFAQQAADVRVLQRRSVGSEAAPGLTQILSGRLAYEGREFDLRQAQALIAMIDADDERKRAVVVLTCTATAEQFATVLPEFHSVVTSIRPVTGQEGTGDGTGDETGPGRPG